MLLAFAATALGYVVLGVVLGVSARWPRDVAIDQAIGLALHAAVVFVRGILPAVLATASACWLWRHTRGSDPGVLTTLALAVVLAALVTMLLLTSSIADWPRLEVKAAPDAVATVALLAAAATASDLLARRLHRTRR